MGCTNNQNINNEIIEEDAEPATLTVMTHDSFAISEEVLAEFENENNVQVQFLRAGDTGTAVNKAALAGDSPLADVFYGVDNTFLSRALEENIFESYQSPLLGEIPDQYKLDEQFRALPVDFGDVCLNYDIEYFAQNKLAIPKKLKDLQIPKYKSLLVVQNPATSSPGLAFLFATIGEFGPDGYLKFWEKLVKNDVLVVNDWETAYYSEFSRWGGTRPIVVSYGSSPPFEVIFAEEEMSDPPTAAIVADSTCFRQIEFVGILRGTENREMAEKWVDFMLSTTFQEDLPLQMYVFPVNENAVMDEAFVEFLAVPDEPVYLAPEDIAEHREEWIEAWTDVVIR
ncbi:MAG: thiamine ABC transporter substrate-binding protein [Chloroflexi bacterium]|nr:thiamine ABC transporter substrate-binding protein [Chloroflexota bacterium]MBT3670150.1 thiamine ABC transporter substrate-binding protein [Chloroflexota bacterium]MBT4004019.1 thiamine ABC transporter substrate-binding protein [Chloroflexota bacterium]MBT4306176.1 thiamine ABC transporter substrate-binding protein [Chloroflexota bacterium]MBT4534556.1 thiamine ABC transporter substrate-binding protein [Chloroflexota bacterium]